MSFSRRAFSTPVRSFGRRRPFVAAMPASPPAGLTLSDDLKLFGTAYLAGLLFMAAYLA